MASNIIELQLCLKYAEATNTLNHPFEEVWDKYESWMTSMFQYCYYDPEFDVQQAMEHLLNIMTTIIENGFTGEWMMFHYDNPWGVIEEYDL